MNLTIKRIYDPVDEEGGTRVLVDRLWPRGVSKEEARIDIWMKELAPSGALRKWFHEDKEGRYEEFCRRYREELAEKGSVARELLDKNKEITLVTAVKDIEMSHLPTLVEFLKDLH